MLAMQSDITKYHCVYTQGAVAFQTPGDFFTHSVASPRVCFLPILVDFRLGKGMLLGNFGQSNSCQETQILLLWP